MGGALILIRPNRSPTPPRDARRDRRRSTHPPSHPNAIRVRVESTLTGAGRRLKIALEIDGVEANLVRVAEDMASEVLSREAITTKAGEWLANPVTPQPAAHPRGRSAARALTGTPHLASPSTRARHAIQPGIPSVPHPPPPKNPPAWRASGAVIRPRPRRISASTVEARNTRDANSRNKTS